MFFRIIDLAGGERAAYRNVVVRVFVLRKRVVHSEPKQLDGRFGRQ